MATGGEEENTEILQDETFDLLCSPCARKNRNTEAEKYCVDCKDYYCSKCVNCHEEIPALSGHKILDKGHFQPAPKQVLPPVPTERCDIHSHKHVDMYCEDHDVVGCTTCMAVDHRLCKGTFYIPDFIKNNPSAPAQQDVQHTLETTAKQLRECQDKFENETERIRNNEDMTIQKITKVRDEIIQRIRVLAELTMAETDYHYGPILDKVDEKLKTLHKNEIKVLSARDSIVSSDNNVSQLFVSNKRGKVAAFKGNMCVDECKIAIPTVDIDFETNEIIPDLIAGLNSLGNFTVRHTQKADLTNVTDKASQSGKRILKPTTDLTGQIFENQNTSTVQLKSLGNIMRKDPNVLLKIKEMKKYHVRIPSDKSDCNINGACVLESGTVILADFNNQNLKQLDGTTYTVTDYCDIPAKPWQVCVINNKEVAVSCRSAGVQLVSLQTKMAPTRQIKPDHKCYGLAYTDGHLLITDITSVYKYTLSGTILQQFSKNPSAKGWFGNLRPQSLFSNINRIAVNDDGSKIYVADEDKGLIAIDRDGNVIGKDSGLQLRKPAYICVTDKGTVLVNSLEDKSIFQFGADCNLKGEVLKSKTDRKFYRALAYHPSNSHMIGGGSAKNEIGVFELV